MAHTPLESDYAIEQTRRQGLKDRSFLLEMPGNDTLRRAVHADIGHCIEPFAQLALQVAEILETAVDLISFKFAVEGQDSVSPLNKRKHGSHTLCIV